MKPFKNKRADMIILRQKSFSTEGYNYNNTIVEQREFNSKTQKALRKAYDLRRGWGLSMAPTKTEIQIQKDLAKDKFFQKAIKKDLKKGRSLNKRDASIGETVDSSINSKAVNMGGIGYHGLPTASGIKLSNSYNKIGKRNIRTLDREGYDHGKSSMTWNKEEMQLRKLKKPKNR